MKNTKNMNFTKKYLGLLLIIVVCKGFAQTNMNEVINVVAPYQPSIQETEKINFNPSLIQLQLEVPQLSYSINSRKYSTFYKPDKLQPAKISGEPLTKLYRSYIKIGYGNYSTSFAELYYNTLRSKHYNAGIMVRHQAAKGGLKDYGYNGYGNNDVKLWNRMFLNKQLTLDANVGFSNRTVYYYGYKKQDFNDTAINKKDIKQFFNTIGFNTSLNSNRTDSIAFRYSLDFNFRNTSDHYKTGENNLLLNGGLFKKIVINKKAQYEYVGGNFIVDYYNNKNSIATSNSALIKVQPKLSSQLDVFAFSIGGNAVIIGDTVSELHVSPAINADLNIVKKIIVAYTGINGDVKKNSLFGHSQDNPFINPAVPITFTKQDFNFYGGLKGAVSSYLSFDIGLSNAKYRNMPFYVNDTSLILKNKFQLVHDDVRLLNLYGQVNSQIREKVKLLLRFDYYQYTMDKELEAWHKPNFKFTMNFNYNIQNKIIVKLDGIAYGEMQARTFVKKTGELKPQTILGIVDLNIGAEYRYSKILSMFVNFNNIEGISYFPYHNYPTYKFFVLGGLSVSL